MELVNELIKCYFEAQRLKRTQPKPSIPELLTVCSRVLELLAPFKIPKVIKDKVEKYKEHHIQPPPFRYSSNAMYNQDRYRAMTSLLTDELNKDPNKQTSAIGSQHTNVDWANSVLSGHILETIVIAYKELQP